MNLQELGELADAYNASYLYVKKVEREFKVARDAAQKIAETYRAAKAELDEARDALLAACRP